MLPANDCAGGDKFAGRELGALCKAGGIAAYLLIAYSVEAIVQLAILGGPPATAAEAFRQLQSNRIEGLLRLDLPTVAVIPLHYLLFLGLFAALRRADRANEILSTALAFVGTTLALATPMVVPMIRLSERYAVAASDVMRVQLLAAGEAIMACGYLARHRRHDGWNPAGVRRCSDIGRHASLRRFQQAGGCTWGSWRTGSTWPTSHWGSSCQPPQLHRW
jgi:hypothetical protein